MRKELLRGNYDATAAVEEKREEGNDDFEREATRQLGGSVAFIRKGKLVE